MSAIGKLTVVESKLFARDTPSFFWGLAFPALLLLVLGAFFPGFRDPVAELGGARLIDLYAPIVLGMAVATLALATLPVYLATYRQNGVLRRLATTPVHPSRLLFAQLTVQVSVAVLAALLAIIVGVVVFEVAVPQNPAGFLLTFLLLAAALFAVGLLVGAIAPSTSAGQSIGMLLYFPMLFFAGIYFPARRCPMGCAP